MLMMAGKGPKRSGKKSQKVRVEFRRNRAKPARDKTWTRLADDNDDQAHDTPTSERVAAKGNLSRRRTVIVSEDGTTPAPDKDLRTGTVVAMLGRIAQVDEGERIWPCSIRRVLRTRSIRGRNAVTVGDRVRFGVPINRVGVEVEGVIESVEPRRGELKRVVGRREHTVVANVDQAVIVSSADLPKPKPHLVDRYIVSALHGGITPIICLNKIDLVGFAAVRRFLSVYEQLGYATLATSAVTRDGVYALRNVLKDRQSVIAGQSGVGKSSLLNVVQPGLNLKIGDIIKDTTKGRHTTTLATLIRLEFGGYVVDTPGVRSFDLSWVSPEEVEQYFVEFVDRLADCKFPDCTHTHEDACAIKRAVERGEIHPQRYDSYVRLFTDPNFRPPAK